MKNSLIPNLLKKLAPNFGATVLMHEDSELIGQIEFPNGFKRYFLYGSIDINTIASAELAGDKHLTSFFLSKRGFPVPREKFINTNADNVNLFEKIKACILEFGYPVIIKPNGESQGIGVMKVNTEEDLHKLLPLLAQKTEEFLVQEYLTGREYRIVVLENKILSIYERIPLYVIGNGIHTIQELCNKKQEFFHSQRRNTILNLNDYRIYHKLAQQGLSFDSVLRKGEKIYLLDNSNLSNGGEPKFVDDLHPIFKNIAITIVRETGLRFGGIDLIIQGSITEMPVQYWVLEVNSSPDLENNFPVDNRYLRHLEQCYFEIFKIMNCDANNSYVHATE